MIAISKLRAMQKVLQVEGPAAAVAMAKAMPEEGSMLMQE
jgi:hypothetical protein